MAASCTSCSARWPASEPIFSRKKGLIGPMQVGGASACPHAEAAGQATVVACGSPARAGLSGPCLRSSGVGGGLGTCHRRRRALVHGMRPAPVFRTADAAAGCGWARAAMRRLHAGRGVRGLRAHGQVPATDRWGPSAIQASRGAWRAARAWAAAWGVGGRSHGHAGGGLVRGAGSGIAAAPTAARNRPLDRACPGGCADPWRSGHACGSRVRIDAAGLVGPAGSPPAAACRSGRSDGADPGSACSDRG